MTLIPTSKAYEDYQRHLEQDSRIAELMQSNNLLAKQVEAQKLQIKELMDWVGTTMKLLEDAQKEIRDLRDQVQVIHSKSFTSQRPLK